MSNEKDEMIFYVMEKDHLDTLYAAHHLSDRISMRCAVVVAESASLVGVVEDREHCFAGLRHVPGCLVPELRSRAPDGEEVAIDLSLKVRKRRE